MSYISTRADTPHEVYAQIPVFSTYNRPVAIRLTYYRAVNLDPGQVAPPAPVPEPPVIPPGPVPGPVINPPVAPPVIPEGDDADDEIIKEQKAVEKTKEVVNEIVANNKPGRVLYDP